MLNSAHDNNFKNSMPRTEKDKASVDTHVS